MSSSREESKLSVHQRFTVAQEGNKRRGSINKFPEEIKQCIEDISGWFYTNAECEGLKSTPGAGEEDLNLLKDAFKNVPDSLLNILKVHNGVMRYYDYIALSISSIIKISEVKSKSSDHWKAEYIPFASNLDDGLLIITSEGVFEFDNEDGIGNKPVSNSHGSYIETLRNDLLSGKYEFIEDVGLVEHIGRCKSPSLDSSKTKK